jgi:hypothetical protein
MQAFIENEDHKVTVEEQAILQCMYRALLKSIPPASQKWTWKENTSSNFVYFQELLFLAWDDRTENV